MLVMPLVALAFAQNAKAQKTSTGAFYSSETECTSVEYDGSMTLRVWGTGKNRSDAIEQAKKQAIWDMLFVGIKKGPAKFDMRPMLLEANAHENHEDYFNRFFRDGGDYKKFISLKDEKAGTRSKEKTGSEVKYGITVRVLKNELKSKLIEDGIIKTDNK